MQQSSTRPSLIYFLGGFHLPVSVQNIMDCFGHITGGHNKDAKFFAKSFFDPINDLDPEKYFVDLHMFDGASVCKTVKKYLRLSILCFHVLLYQSISAIICLKVWHLLRKYLNCV